MRVSGMFFAGNYLAILIISLFPLFLSMFTICSYFPELHCFQHMFIIYPAALFVTNRLTRFQNFLITFRSFYIFR